jgi:hypothetical protein
MTSRKARRANLKLPKQAQRLQRLPATEEGAISIAAVKLGASSQRNMAAPGALKTATQKRRARREQARARQQGLTSNLAKKDGLQAGKIDTSDSSEYTCGFMRYVDNLTSQKSKRAVHRCRRALTHPIPSFRPFRRYRYPPTLPHYQR